MRYNRKSEIKGKAPVNALLAALNGLKRVTTNLDAKAPAEAAGFKAWLQSLAERTSQAASAGGFIGFDGVMISDAKRATLSEIESALG